MYTQEVKPKQASRAIATESTKRNTSTQNPHISSFQYKPVFRRPTSDAPMQFAFGGTYANTDKSDAHHMPSARAIAAIIEVNKDTDTEVSDCHTLAVNDIYRGAPAVWMPHDEHKNTRTFGGRSTGALSSDFGIIKNSDPATAFTAIQHEDVEDFNEIRTHPNSITGLGEMASSGATENTIGKIEEAINTQRDVMASRSSETTMTPVNLVKDAAKAIWERAGTLDKGVQFIFEKTGESIVNSTLYNIAKENVENVQERVANAIRTAFEALP